MTEPRAEAVELPLAPGMAECLASLHRCCFNGVTGADWSAPAIGLILAMPETGVWLSIGNGQPGGLLLARGAGDDGEILTFGVLPEQRRAGHGRVLMRAAAAWARGKSLDRLVLEVAVSNAAALSFYAGCGFVEVGRRKGYYGVSAGRVDALVLAAPVVQVLQESRA